MFGIRYRFKPAQIDCYTSLVSARGVTEVRPESFDHPTKGMACTLRALGRVRWLARRTAASEVFNSGPANSRCTIASSVRSGSAVIKSSSQAACGSSGERLLPPLGRGLTLPVWSWSSARRTAEAALTWNRFAACLREVPAKISETTRDRRSSECGIVPMSAFESETTWTHAKPLSGSHPSITFDSTQLPDALAETEAHCPIYGAMHLF